MKNTISISPTESITVSDCADPGTVEIEFSTGFLSFKREMSPEAAAALAGALDLACEAIYISNDRSNI